MILYFCPDCGSHSRNTIVVINEKQEIACKKCGWVGTWNGMVKVETEEN